MARSSLSHNPLLRVSRPVSACSRCRSAKIKCDGKLPACTACEKAGRENECSAANDQFARGKERSYVAALELRIEKLERRLKYAQHRKASVALHETVTSAPPPEDRRDSLAKIRAAIHRKAARNREDSDVNSLLSDMGALSITATTRDFGLSAGNTTFARLVLAAVINTPIPEPSHPGLPSREEALALVQYYINHLYSLFPCFAETTLWNIHDLIYKDRIVKERDYWMFYMVLAISSVAQSQVIGDSHYTNGVEFVSKALESADLALVPGQVTQIQCLLLLTQYSMLDPAHFHSWHLIGFTTRSIVDLGLHQDPPMSSVSDKSALDMRRRIFYCAYALDRSISMVHARPFSFVDDTIHVAFPKQTSRESASAGSGATLGPQSVDAALLLFQLRRAQSYWYQELYQSEDTPLPDASFFVWQMCLDMREWGDSLPANLPSGIRRLFDQELRYSYVYCISPSSRAPQISDYHRILIFEYATAYLDEMYDITRNAFDSAFYTYHDALKVYFMANQFLAVLRDAEGALLSGAPVQIPPQRPGVPPPPIPRRIAASGESNIVRSIKTMERVPQTLAQYSKRWLESCMLKESFEKMSQEPMERLKMLQDLQQGPNLGSVPGQYVIATRPGGGTQQVPMQMAPQPQLREMRWVDVDPSHAGRGAGR